MRVWYEMWGHTQLIQNGARVFFKKAGEKILILANAHTNQTQWHYVYVDQLPVSYECWTLWSPNIVQVRRSFLENEAVVTSHIL